MLDLTIKRRLYVFALNTLAVTLYLVFGGIVLHIVEDPKENEIIANQSVLLDTLLANNATNLTYEVLIQLQDSGVCDVRFYNSTSYDLRKWSIAGSTFFSLTVITTIGYGNQVPNTYTGKSFTVIYAIVGIGIISQLLSSCATTLLSIVKRLWLRAPCCTPFSCLPRRRGDDDGTISLEPVFPLYDWERLWVHHCSGGYCPIIRLPDLINSLTDDITRHRPELKVNIQSRIGKRGELMTYIMDSAETDKDGKVSSPEITRLIAIFYCTAFRMPKSTSFVTCARLITLCFMWGCLWAVAFMAIEGWDYREALWFCAVTMSTIGFGDYHPEKSASRGLAYLFIITGVGLSAMSLAAIWEWFEEKRFWFLQKHATHKMIRAHEIPMCLKPEHLPASPRASPKRQYSNEFSLQAPLNLPDLSDSQSAAADDETPLTPADKPFPDNAPRPHRPEEGNVTPNPQRGYFVQKQLSGSFKERPPTRGNNDSLNGRSSANKEWITRNSRGSVQRNDSRNTSPVPSPLRERRRTYMPLKPLGDQLGDSQDSGGVASPLLGGGDATPTPSPHGTPHGTHAHAEVAGGTPAASPRSIPTPLFRPQSASIVAGLDVSSPGKGDSGGGAAGQRRIPSPLAPRSRDRDSSREMSALKDVHDGARGGGGGGGGDEPTVSHIERV